MEAIMSKRTGTENGYKGCRQGWGRFYFLDPLFLGRKRTLMHIEGSQILSGEIQG